MDRGADAIGDDDEGGMACIVARNHSYASSTKYGRMANNDGFERANGGASRR